MTEPGAGHLGKRVAAALAKATPPVEEFKARSASGLAVLVVGIVAMLAGIGLLVGSAATHNTAVKAVEGR